jgi:signal transduction histidine kinase
MLAPAQTELSIVRHELERIAEIVHRLLDVQQPQPRPEGSCRTWSDLELVLDEVLTLLHTQLRHAGIVVDRRAVSPLPVLWADADQLKQVFLNLNYNRV